MFVIFGKKVRLESRGVVADRCALCRRVTKATVESLYLADHLFFIALTPGEIVETRAKCQSCGGLVKCSPRSFDTLVQERDGRGLDEAELLRRTNSRLLSEIEAIGEVEIAVSKWRRGESTGKDPRDRAAELKLRRIEAAGENVDEAARRFAKWSQLDDADRDQLLADLDRAEKTSEYNKAIVALANWGAQRFKPLDKLWVLVIAGFISAPLILAFHQKGAGVMRDSDAAIFLGSALFCSIFIFVFVDRARKRRFFRTQFVPEARRRGIDIEHSMAWLSWRHQRQGSDSAENDAPVRALAAANRQLADVVQELTVDSLTGPDWKRASP